MLRYLLASLALVVSTAAWADDGEHEIECAGEQNELRITHLDDSTETDGLYRFELQNKTSHVVETFETLSVDYFSLLDQLWQSGQLSFKNSNQESIFKLDGSPFAKRNGLLTAESASSEAMSCEVKVALPFVSCVTNAAEDGSQYAMQFRHGTDMGSTTGYYISRVFKLVGTNSTEFETNIVGAFSLNRRLVNQAFEKGDDLQFQFTSGERVVLTDWVSAREFKGQTDMGGEIVPLSCALTEPTR